MGRKISEVFAWVTRHDGDEVICALPSRDGNTLATVATTRPRALAMREAVIDGGWQGVELRRYSDPIVLEVLQVHEAKAEAVMAEVFGIEHVEAMIASMLPPSDPAPPHPWVIRELLAYVCLETPTDEGLPAGLLAGEYTPLLGADVARMVSLRRSSSRSRRIAPSSCAAILEWR